MCSWGGTRLAGGQETVSGREEAELSTIALTTNQCHALHTLSAVLCSICELVAEMDKGSPELYALKCACFIKMLLGFDIFISLCFVHDGIAYIKAGHIQPAGKITVYTL